MDVLKFALNSAPVLLGILIIALQLPKSWPLVVGVALIVLAFIVR